MANRGFYVGIDIDDTYAVASFFEAGMKEPATVSMVAGSEIFQIPVQITRKRDTGQWLIGEEAVRVAREQEGTAADCLLGRAINGEEVSVEGESYPAEELLVLFLKKLMGYAGGLYGKQEPDGCAFSVEGLTGEMSKLLFLVGEKLGMLKEQLMLLDRKSAFYYFALNRQNELWLHDVCLYDYRDLHVKCMRLHRNPKTEPQLVTIDEQMRRIDTGRQDEAFYRMLQEHLRGPAVSSVYLVGDAFDGDWMKLSLAYMCRGRRAFIGKNLYAKGACYAIMAAKDVISWPYVYLGDNEMKVNVSLKVRNRGVEEFFTLINAGESRYEAEGVCEVILDDTREIAIWLQLPNSREAKVEKLVLSDLPERENKTTRLRIEAKPLSDSRIKIQIKDLGFGELVKSSGKSWEYSIST